MFTVLGSLSPSARAFSRLATADWHERFGSMNANSDGRVPRLVRMRTIQSSLSGSARAVLSIMSSLDSMAQKWTPEERSSRRRIVRCLKKQNGYHLEATFRPVPINERPPGSICISCIYWAEKHECFVTSVDIINLLEQLLAAPARFPVEEKNRIRRNLEKFKPFTVSGEKAESEEFFKLIMAFGAPRPRTLKNSIKVFSWKSLDKALKRIVSKYGASPSSLPPASSRPSVPGHHVLTPMTMSPSWSVLPPTPGSLFDYVNMVDVTDWSAGSWPLAGASLAPYDGNTSSARALSPRSTAPKSPSSANMGLGGLFTWASTSTHSYGHHQLQQCPLPPCLPATSDAAVVTGPGATAVSAAHGYYWSGYGYTYSSASPSYGNSHDQQGQQQQQYLYGYRWWQ